MYLFNCIHPFLAPQTKHMYMHTCTSIFRATNTVWTARFSVGLITCIQSYQATYQGLLLTMIYRQATCCGDKLPRVHRPLTVINQTIVYHTECQSVARIDIPALSFHRIIGCWWGLARTCVWDRRLVESAKRSACLYTL